MRYRNNSFYEKALSFINQQCRSLAPKALQGFQSQLSQAYRERHPTKNFIAVESILTYAATRMPATYHALQSCYQKLETTFKPKRLLDLGAGPGTASLAALDYWKDFQQITLIENHPLMYTFQKNLWEFLNPTIGYETIHDTINYLETIPAESFDIVILSYVLGELKQTDHLNLINQALEKTSHYGLIVTPGTPHDFQYLLKIRNHLLNKGAFIIAPCTHQKPCPLTTTEDWCHFNIRLQRSSLHQVAKKAQLSYEDEKFCYLLFSKVPPSLPLTQGRVIRKPIRRSGHILLDICAKGELNRHIISKTHAHFKKGSKIKWGDIW